MLVTSGRIFALATALLLGVLVSAPTASGALHQVASGEAKIELGRGLYAQLREHDVQTMKLRRGKVQGRFATVPVAGGELDPASGEGGVMLGGGIKFRLGERRAALGGLVFNPAKRTLLGKIRGQAMTIASASDVAHTRDGFGADFVAERLLLTGRAAKGLNHQLGLPGVFKAGRSLGAASVSVQPEAVTITGGKIAIGGPDTAFSKLESLEVQMGIWGASERWSAPGENYFLFEVEPTTMTPDASTGILAASGNDGTTLEIHAPPPRNMLLRGPRIDLASRELSATISALSAGDPVAATIATLDYGEATLQIRPDVRVFELMGIRAVANQFIADRLNERFATSNLFQAGETLARVTLTLRAE